MIERSAIKQGISGCFLQASNTPKNTTPSPNHPILLDGMTTTPPELLPELPPELPLELGLGEFVGAVTELGRVLATDDEDVVGD